MEIAHPVPDRIVILGASCRAAAASATAAGLEVHAADLFGDLDLTAASFRIADPYPAGLAAAAAVFPPAPWLFTGAMENHPDLIALIAARRPLAGCRPEVIRRARDPDGVASAARLAGLAFPETRRDPGGLPRDGSWLRKPLRSAGGHGIGPWRGAVAGTHHAALPDGWVWQRRLAGHSWSAAYLVTAEGGRLLGLTRQLVGRRWCRAAPFAYSGSVASGLSDWSLATIARLRRLGDRLGSDFALRGLVGVDLMLDRQGRLHVIEINPRMTASMELVERSRGRSLVADHLAACGFPLPRSSDGNPQRGSWSKAILYADRPLWIDEAAVAGLRAAAGGPLEDWPLLADIPRPPRQIEAGRPVCTLFALGDSPRASLRQLRRRVAAVAVAVHRAGQPASRRCAGSDSATYCIR